jgi:hypothetical protein
MRRHMAVDDPKWLAASRGPSDASRYSVRETVN